MTRYVSSVLPKASKPIEVGSSSMAGPRPAAFAGTTQAAQIATEMADMTCMSSTTLRSHANSRKCWGSNSGPDVRPQRQLLTCKTMRAIDDLESGRGACHKTSMQLGPVIFGPHHLPSTRQGLIGKFKSPVCKDVSAAQGQPTSALTELRECQKFGTRPLGVIGGMQHLFCTIKH